ncbi:MAG: M20 family metallopeptidase [Verrucomicrobia bacterium]|nr:M20 family metallopeptidase [Verrucomicrobiota bacterium]
MSAINSVTDLCRALVRIPSENPSGAPESAGEEAISRFVGEFLNARGATVELEYVAEGRPNVYGWFPRPENAKSTLLFAPHLDTVPGRSMTIDPFAGDVVDGRLFGRGATDTKGPMAAMLWALATTDLPKLNIAVGFVGLVDEEADQLGSKVCAERHKVDFVLAGEPTNLDVVYTHKGTAWLKLHAKGKSAHASDPSAGVNAIELLTEAFASLKTEFPSLCPTHPNHALGEPTISLGTIVGGTKINVVPDQSVAEIDIRTIPGQESMAEAVRDFVSVRFPTVEVSPIKVSQPLYTDPAHPFIQKLVALGSKCIGAPWFCDAAFFAERNIPAVAIGPGSIEQAHTSDEFIAVRDLERGAEFFRRFLNSFSTPPA